VVRAVRVEERREVLDLSTAGPELEHPAAVERDPVRLTVVVDTEDVLYAAETRRLRVERPRRIRKTLDVRDRVDWRIPGHALAVRLPARRGLIWHRAGPSRRPRCT